MTEIRLETDGNVPLVTLDGMGLRNALDLESAASLVRFCSRIDDDAGPGN